MSVKYLPAIKSDGNDLGHRLLTLGWRCNFISEFYKHHQKKTSINFLLKYKVPHCKIHCLQGGSRPRLFIALKSRRPSQSIYFEMIVWKIWLHACIKPRSFVSCIALLLPSSCNLSSSSTDWFFVQIASSIIIYKSIIVVMRKKP